MCQLRVYIIGKASGQQQATSSYVLEKSKVTHGFLTVWRVGTSDPLHCSKVNCILQGSESIRWTNVSSYMSSLSVNICSWINESILKQLLLLFSCCAWLFCDPMDCNPPGSSLQGISQASILERVAISFSSGSSWPRNGTLSLALAGRLFTTEPPGKPHE